MYQEELPREDDIELGLGNEQDFSKGDYTGDRQGGKVEWSTK